MKFKGASFWGALGGATLLALCSNGGGSFADAFNEQEASAFMERFDIPKNHITLEWATSGTGLQVTEVGGIKYKWLPKEGSVSAKVGYANLWDKSARSYCTRSDALVDTQRYLGQRLMAVGSCPNYGKYIAFVDRRGEPADSLERFQDEIHEGAMPFTTKGCSTSAQLGDEEVPMEQSGWAMYSGYMVRCPYNDTVYTQDLLKDGEFDSEACNFVTSANPLVFLDTSSREGSLAYTPYAFHGKGGHKGYDFVGDGIGCPPYKPPVTTRSMKRPEIANDPFRCSQLSRCTSLCWPWDVNRPCFRSLPASFNHEKQECLILGRHTQTHITSDCAVRTSSDPNAKYCVKASKAVASSHLTYVTAFTRPDYQTACPPRGALKDAIFGSKSADGKVCVPLTAVRTVKSEAGQCGVHVFEASGDDTPSSAGGTGKSVVNWASWVPGAASAADGSCRLHDQVPNCVVKTPGAFAFTALTAADTSLAESVPESVWMPGPCDSAKCQNGGSCDIFTGKCSCTACYSGDACQNKTPGCCETDVECNHGTCSTEHRCNCQPGFVGDACDKNKCEMVECLNGGTCQLPDGVCQCPTGFFGPRCESSVCDFVKCQNGGTCATETGTCVCPPCFMGDACDVQNPKCCASDQDCHSPNGSCKDSLCVCKPGVSGDTCSNGGCEDTVCLNGGSCDETSFSCVCPKCTQGTYCEVAIKNCCQDDADCHAPNGKCNAETNRCECTEGFFGPNCKDLCQDVDCGSHGKCEAQTGHCDCDDGWKGSSCSEEDDSFCKGVTCGDNQICNNADGSCICKPGYTGIDCSEKDDRCKDVCEEGKGVIRENSDGENSSCSTDCYSACCRHVLEDCQGVEEVEKCVREAMGEKEDEQCCVLSEGLSYGPFLGAAAALVALLLIAGGVSYHSRRGQASGSGSEGLPSEEVTGGRRRSTRKDSAISVDFDDYASNPDDDGDVNVLVDDDGGEAQEAVWDEGDY